MILKNFNNSLSILPFYESLEEQNHRKSYAYGETYPLYVPMGAVPPFSIMADYYIGDDVSAVNLYRYDGSLVGDIFDALTDAGMYYSPLYVGGDKIMVVYPSIMPQSITTEEGRYYLEVVFGDHGSVWSDVFTVVGATHDLLMLQWWDDDNLITDDGAIQYSRGYRNTLWLATQLGKPEYTFEDEGERRDGYFFPEKRLSYKTYKFTFLASEYVCDIIRLTRISDHVTVRDKFGHMYRCDQFLVTPKWETQGDLASVECEFTTNTIAKKIGQAYDMGGGDYNNDYNADFNNQNINQ